MVTFVARVTCFAREMWASRHDDGSDRKRTALASRYFRWLTRPLGRLRRDERGTILVQFTVYLVAIFGFAGLALDVSRALMLHSSLQDVADAAALAAAAKLDGTATAITSAKSAAQSIADQNRDNVFRLWEPEGSATLQFNFYAPDSTNSDLVGVAADSAPTLARYVQVTIGTGNPTWQVAPTFLAAVGAGGNAQPSATAMARVRYVTCAPTRSYMCQVNLGNPAAGDMFQLQDKGVGGSGNWGITDLPADVANYSALFAQKNNAKCTDALVDQRTGNGQHTDIVTGINVRFDQPVSNATADESLTAPLPVDGLKATANCKKFNAAYPQGKNGFDQITNYSACNKSGFSCPMPRLAANFSAYWQNHHGAASSWPNDLTTGQPMTRYQAYQYEFNNLNSSTWITDTAEPHAPQCSARVDDATRRVLNVAILDTCPTGNSGGPYLFTKYAELFLTEPAFLATGQPNVIAEFVALHHAGDGGSLHKVAELVR